MQRLFRPLFRALMLACCAIAAIAVVLVPHPARSLDFSPPDRGAPERVDAGGARFADFEREGDREAPIFVDGEALECPLTAVLPEGNYGLTFEPYPSVFVHIPDLPGAEVVFSLRDADDRILYQLRYLKGERHGSVGLSVPKHANVAPLELYEPYRWTLELPEQEEQVSGAIVRVAPTEEFAAQLAEATPEQRLELLAETGIWYDMLEQLAQLHRNNPDDPRWMPIWDDVTEDVGLMKVGDKPLL